MFVFLYIYEGKNNTSHSVTSNEQDNITSAVNGKLWGLTACGWGSESGRSRGGRVLHPHLPPLTSLLAPSIISHSHNHNLWMEHPAQSSSSALHPGPCLIFSWCWEFIVWIFFFFNALLPLLNRKSKEQDCQGRKGGLFLKHLPWSTCLPRAEVMWWVKDEDSLQKRLLWAVGFIWWELSNTYISRSASATSEMNYSWVLLFTNHRSMFQIRKNTQFKRFVPVLSSRG